jgi:hypothetical protein
VAGAQIASRIAALLTAAAGCLAGPAALAQAGLPTSQRAIQAYCNDRAQAGEESDVRACVAREAARVRERTVACAKQGQIQDVRTAELAAFMERCFASADFSRFQQQQAANRAAEGRPLGREFGVPLETLQSWTNFDGAIDVRLSKVLLAQWVGEFQAELPEGSGELIAEVQYSRGTLIEKPFVGVVHLQGTMKRGRLVGPVKALKHVAWDESKDRAETNDFIDGRSAGLLADGSGNCDTSALVQDGSTGARFYGTCRSGRAYQGLVVYNYRGVEFDLACLARGAVAGRGVIDAFQPCASFWRHLPGACEVGDYRGQCRNNRAHGVGIVKATSLEATFNRSGGAIAALPNLFSPGTRSYYLRRGMFVDGELAGFGYYGLMEGCGMAGCSGDRGEQIGWFERGRLRFPCPTPQACSEQLSGADYTQWAGRVGGLASGAWSPSAADTFASALEAFRASGAQAPLRRAVELARSNEERAALEYEFIRIAGFDKAFTTTVVLNAGSPASVTFDQRDRVLGLIRTTDSKVPLQVSWRIRNDPDAVALRHGQYVVRAVIGVRVQMKRVSCLGTLCGEQLYSEVFERRVEPRFRPGSGEASGQFDLRQTANSASVLFGSVMVSDFVDAEPFVRIEAVAPSP